MPYLLFSDVHNSYGPQCIGLSVTSPRPLNIFSNGGGCPSPRLGSQPSPGMGGSATYLRSSSSHVPNQHQQLQLPIQRLQTQSPTPSDISSIRISSRNNLNTPTLSMASTSDKNTFLEPCPPGPHSVVKESWKQYNVLPAVTTGGSITCGETIENGFTHTANTLFHDAASTHSHSLSPFLNFENSPSGSNLTSPRNSARSKKRALSISPLSADGIDLNSLIRTSPTSLVAYINGSRCSSTSVSPLPGQQHAPQPPGCYGHLVAHRNSSSSPHSGSGASSGAPPPPRFLSFTPQISTPANNINIHNSGAPTTHPHRITGITGIPPLLKKEHHFGGSDLDGNLMAYYNMSSLELQGQLDNTVVSSTTSAAAVQDNQMVIQPYLAQTFKQETIDPADMELFDENINPATSLPVGANLPLSSSNLAPHPPLHPPPSYAQAVGQQQQQQQSFSPAHTQGSPTTPSGNEGEEEEGRSSRQHVCKWIDCNQLFQEQEDLVRHLEKVHIDQRKGEDFTCFWQACSRRYKPFNARYKLLIHMRVHSGEKPNKCTVRKLFCDSR